jgi:uncharacterized protein (DUF1778 family)
MPRTATAKKERINLRLDKAAKRRIEKAASYQGTTVSSFILSSALTSADEALQKHETMVLEREDAEIFFDAILDPPKPNAAFRRAMKEYRKRVVSR